MGVRKNWLVVFIIFSILYIGLVFFSTNTSNSSELLKPSSIQTGIQNFTVAYDRPKKVVLVGAYQNALLAYSEKGEKLWEFATKGPVREIKIDDKNRKIYIGCEDRNLYILDADTGVQVTVIKVQRRIYSMDINTDASLIAVSAGINAFKHDLLLYDGSGKEIFYKQIGSTSKKVVFNSDYSKILLGTDRAEIVLFDRNGKELKKKKLDYEIVGLVSLKESKSVAVLTKKATLYILDENLNQVTKGSFTGEGMSLSSSSDMEWFGIGTREGDFYVADRAGVLQYQSRFENQVTGSVFTASKTYVTGLGDFVYELDTHRLANIKLLGKISSVLKVTMYIFPVLLLFLLVFSFNSLRCRVKAFGKIIYKHRIAYLLLLPTFVLLLLFNYYPVFVALIRSFTDWSMHQQSTRDIKFIGLDNFWMMLEEGYFLTGLKNLLILLATAFIKVLTVPLLIAELVFAMRNDRQKYWFRFLFVVPMVVPGIVGILMWQNMYDPNIGMVNATLRTLGLENMTRVWLGEAETAIWAIVFMGFPFINAFAFLVYYGGLIDIPSSLFEAAKVDGSNVWWNFTRIHVPLVTAQMKMLVILTFIGTIQESGNIFILTGGGPGSATYVPGLELYFNAAKFGRYGYACALGLVMFAVILIGTILNTKIKVEADYNS
jgi:ABC-type sugar transport system permease subunit/outer membrane protein assembly factor BamB